MKIEPVCRTPSVIRMITNEESFLYGGLFVIIAIVGIQNGVQGKNSPKKGMAIAGMVLNIIALVVAVLFVLLGIVLKFMS